MSRVASLDLGSNSTRLLVADVEDGRLEEVDRRLAITRLGDRVDETGRLGDEAMERVETRVAEYVERARELGASSILATATSAVRDAANGPEFLAELGRRNGIRTRLLTGEEEARTTFRGVTSARTVTGPLVVCDIGGGSTELLAGGPHGVRWAQSLDIGCVRMSERHLHDDPPSGEQLAALRAEVRQMLPRLAGEGDLVGVAGTITTLATIDLDLEKEIPEQVDGHRLRAGAVASELERLAALPLAERREVRGLMPERAPTIVAGAAILIEVLGTADAEALTVSERDILHGAALLAAEQA